MHFGNVRGHIASKALEQAITSKFWEDRILGGNQNQLFSNELEFSMSTNVGTTWTPDLEHRMIIIDLFLAQENPNDRIFKHPDLHRWARERRHKILSALAAFVKKWDAAGRPDGSAPFASFPEWARVVGGIMESCDLGTPRQPSNRGRMTGGDETTEDMKMLYRAAQEQFGREWCSKKQLYDLAKQLELFSWWDLEDRKGQTAFGKAINRFNGRHLGGVAMEGGGTKNNRRYRFALVSGSSKISATDAGTLRTSDEVYSGAMPEPTLSPNPKKGTSRTLGTSTTQQEVKKIVGHTQKREQRTMQNCYTHTE